MSDKQEGSYWARLARQMQQERLQEHGEAAQERADRRRSEAEEPARETREVPRGRRHQGLRP